MELITRKEMMELLRITRTTVTRWEKSGLLQPIKIDKKLLYDLVDIKTLIAVNKASNTAGKHGEVIK